MNRIIMKNFTPLLILLIIGCTQQVVEENDTMTNYTMNDLSLHANSSDCWLLIDGLVYDVTNFVNGHPGGESITQGCGLDATELFETRPMGSGTAHSGRARTLLNTYIIGQVPEID